MPCCSQELPSDSESESSEDSDAEETIDLANISISGTTLKDVLDTIQTDESVLCCSLGEAVSTAAKKCASRVTAPVVEQFASIIVGEMQALLSSCTSKKTRHMKLSLLWRKYHVLRLSSTVRQAWEDCATYLSLSDNIKHLTLQVILKRIMSSTINLNTTVTTPDLVEPEKLSEREENVVRYMAGYVVSKVKKRFPDDSKLLEPDLTIDFLDYDPKEQWTEWTEQIN